ncbi:Oidioi.mRNA.OKI2018_I69.PAR.g13180.t2.cds [Oikopleura dioica]|nr:Oidioi.mRNA.OKI2018_I69.PAR.g13180.t2.cds [Oikopleura dioica]
MGPTGGNGGRGGNIWLRASSKLSSLTHLKEIYTAQDGRNGGKDHQYGRNGKDLTIEVPIGTLVKNAQGSVIVDLVNNGDGFLIASGGAGGFGNKEFANVDNPTPRNALPGEEGEIVNAEIELRSIADFGLVGLPNAGKSSLTMTITNTDLEVSDIPGTTLIPHLGHLTYRDKVSLSIADLPGIEPDQPRATRFLQHCARCVSLIYLIDGDDFHEQHAVEQFYTIRKHLADYDAKINAEVRELELAKSQFQDRFDSSSFDEKDERYSSLAEKPFIVCISKADQPGNEYRAKMLNDELKNFEDKALYYPKYLHHSQEVTVDAACTVEVKARIVKVTGPRGSLEKNFRHLKVEMKQTGPRSILVEKWMGSSKDRAAVRTVCSHISNMSKGVTLGFRYKLRSAYAHFPINCAVVQGGAVLEVRNFLGEKFLRVVPMAEGVTVEISKEMKDQLYVSGNDIEAVSKSAARIQQSTTVKNKDIRKFLDGIYVSEKTTIEQPADE